jgi:hypothetical protein
MPYRFEVNGPKGAREREGSGERLVVESEDL